MSFNQSNEIQPNQYISKKLIDQLVPSLIYYPHAKKEAVPEGSLTKTISFRQWANLPLATTPLTEGVNPTQSNPTQSSVSATLSQYGAYSTVTDVAQLFYDRNLLSDIANNFAIQAATTIDTIVYNVVASGTNIIYGDGSVSTKGTITSTMTLTTGNITRMIRFLERNNVNKFSSDNPLVSKMYMLVIHPDQAADVRQDPGFQNAALYSSPNPTQPNRSDLFNGELGCWEGARIITTTINSPTANGAGNINVYPAIMFGDNYYAVPEISSVQTYIKEPTSSDTSNPLNLYSTVGWKILFTALILDNIRGIINFTAAKWSGTV